MQPASECSEAQSYREEDVGATARLREEVMEGVDREGSLSFRDFFELVLYHPDWGYYARSDRTRTGREGDFFTAVSVGPLFGRILAEYAFARWQAEGQPACFRIVEWGAEQGDLARDIHRGVSELGGEFAKAFCYTVVEPLAAKRALLRTPLAGVAEVVAEGAELAPQSGIVLANELLDALSFWMVKRQDGQWWERRVEKDGEGEFTFGNYPPNDSLAKRLQILPEALPEGYETELRPSLTPLLAEMKAVLTSGELLFFDYGFERDDLYHRSRTTGTLRTYDRHQAEENPLVQLGQLDITAHVDFTALREDAEELDLLPQRLESQGHFLTRAAAPYLIAREGQIDAQFIRQFQTLTHPAHLGTRFSVFRALISS